MTTDNMHAINKNTAGDNNPFNKRKRFGQSFKEVPNIKMNGLQKDTMKILVEDDKKIEKLRGAKVNITMDELNKNIQKSPLKKLGANKQNFNFKQNNQIKKSSLFDDGPLNFKKLNIDLNNFFSFTELSSQVKLTEGGPSVYTKPISVVMKLPSDPDPSIKKEIENMEKKREKFESKIFQKAKQELKLITAITIKQLQVYLNRELLPFFVVSKNSLAGINKIISTHLPAQTKTMPRPRFLQIDKDEINKKFPHFNLKNDESLNKHVYSKILNLFSGSPDDIESVKDVVNNNNNDVNEMSNDKVNDTKVEVKADLLKSKINFNYEKCVEFARSLTNLDLNCDLRRDDYNTLNDYLYTSFLEMKDEGGGSSDFINLKFAQSDDPYPTIEKLVSQMMTRRDLSEKYIRLQILEYQMHLQKAENEMVEDILHESLAKIIAKYGPAIEGMKEHIH